MINYRQHQDMEPESYPKNIRPLVMHQLLILLKEQYDTKSFNINKAVRTATESFLADDILQLTSSQHITMDTIYEQLLSIVFYLGKSPSIWISLLENDEIHSQSEQIVINTPEVLTKVYRKITENIQQEFINSKKKRKQKMVDFTKQYLDQKTMFFFAQFLGSVAHQICLAYKNGVKFIKEEISTVEEQLKKSKIMNSYLLFSILKQETTLIETKIQDQLTESLFRNVPNVSTEFFSKYVLKNYERLKLTCDWSEEVKILTEEEEEILNEKMTESWLKFLAQNKQLTLKRLASKDGQQAILVVDNTEKPRNEQNQRKGYILELSPDNKQIRVVNSETTQKSWYALEMSQSIEKLQDLVAIQSSEQLQQELLLATVPLDAYAAVGGSVGKCLAGINDYSSANQFLKDLTKKTVISGSTMYLMMEIPILNYFFIAGGFTYSFYQAFSNEATNNPKKFKKFGQATVSAVGTATTSIAGMIVGQALIPVPFVGAFVGGVIGGFIGEKGTKSITHAIEKSEFKKLIKYLKSHVQKNGYWHFNVDLLDALGINYEYFEKNNPFKGSSKNTWATAICFCVVSFYESKRFAQFNKNKLAELEKEMQKNKDRKITGEDQIYQNQFDLVAITNFLTVHSLWLKDNMKNLEATVKHVIIG